MVKRLASCSGVAGGVMASAHSAIEAACGKYKWDLTPIYTITRRACGKGAVREGDLRLRH